MAGTDFVGEIGDAVENLGGLINVVAQVLKVGGTGENEVGAEAGFNRAADIGFHGIADHDDLFGHGEEDVGKFAAGSIEHEAVRLAEVIGGFAGAGFEEGGDRACAGTSAFGTNGTPIVWIGGEEPSAAFDAFVRFGEFFEGDRDRKSVV